MHVETILSAFWASGKRQAKLKWQGKYPDFRIASAGDVLDIPKKATDLETCRREFFQAVENPAAYR